MEDHESDRCAVNSINGLGRQNDNDAINPLNMKKEASSIEIDGEGSRPHGKHGGWKTMPFIFGNEISEKLAAIGFSANLIIYLTQTLHMDYVKAANTLTNFSGTSSLTPLIGAFLADAYVGRFWMITGGSIIYFLGTSLLTLSAITPSLQPPPCNGAVGTSSCPAASGRELVVVFLGFLLTAMGAGGIRPCVATFGADQLDVANKPLAEQQRHGGKNLWSFFNWYYFCMGVSALLAVTVIVYIQDNVGWGLGFGIPAALMLVSIVSFLVGGPLYVHVPPMGSPFTRLARVLVAAFRKRKLTGSNSNPAPPPLHELSDKELATQGPSYQTRLLHTHQFMFLDRAAMRVEGDAREDGSFDPWRLCSVTEVEELKTILRMAPIWASGILLATASAQQSTFSVLQARTMDRHVVGGKPFQIPAGSMSVFSIASLVISVPLYDRVFMPMARRMTGHPRGITFLQRMGVGFVLSTLATSVAAVVEVKRKQAARSHGLLDSPSFIIPVSVFWLFPQYCLHGVAEAFMSIGHLEFFYDQSPESMRSTAAALFWTSISVGSYLSSFLVAIIHRYTSGPNAWLPKNLNRGHLDYFFWLLTFLQGANFIFFCVSARWYKYKAVARPEDAASKEII